MSLKIRRSLARLGQTDGWWPWMLLVLVVLAPTACLLWFMNAAMQNERLAVRQKLVGAYRGHLEKLRGRLEDHWRQRLRDLQKLGPGSSAPALFASCVQSGQVDSVLVFDGQGRLLYPNIPLATQTGPDRGDGKLAEASGLERFRKDFTAAARKYEAIANETQDPNLAARALQARTRCLVQAGDTEAAINVVTECLEQDRYRDATDGQGRVIVANAELLVLELLKDPASALFGETIARLARRLMDYEHSDIAASQKLFLMKEVQLLSPETPRFPTLAAEDLAARWSEAHTSRGNPNEADTELRPSPVPGVWECGTPDGRLLALFRGETLPSRMQNLMSEEPVPAEVGFSLLAPAAESETALLTLPAGPFAPGWRLAFSLRDQTVFDAATNASVATHFWTGMLVVAVVAILALAAARGLRRQVTLARLKNDLVANVSHELKTPLASMRLLVDTLMNAETLQEQTVRDYLPLLASENERLGRVIDNFLTFSRLDRKKYAFHFEPTRPSAAIQSAVESVRDHLQAPGFKFEAQIADHLPAVDADPEALAIALRNLLENACKYSEDIKHIVLRAYSQNGHVAFEVEDHGIGIPARERKRIFNRFYQVDQSLSRKGAGCGLGLSIVQFIATAHRGHVLVESEPGRGSTFTLRLPAASDDSAMQQELDAERPV